MKQHAILLPGQLRCIDDNLLCFLDSCKDISKIFIITDRCFDVEAEKLVSLYGADLVYIEDVDEADIGISSSDFHMIHPEYVKLEAALRHLLKWEASHSHSFEYIHRLRTDVMYPVSFGAYIKPLTEDDFNVNTLLLYWATNYSGLREAMLRLIGHPEFHIRYKKDIDFFNVVTKQIDVKALAASTYAEPFIHSFPVAILKPEESVEDFHKKIQEEYPSYIDAAESFVKRVRLEQVPEILYKSLHSRDSALVRSYNTQWFPSFPEHIFFLYMNSRGLASGNYSFSNPFVETPLKFSRHATTPFTVKIFSQIQAKDYSFLECNYPWEDEINQFIATKMYPGYALQKLATIDLTVLSDSSCKVLYRVIDLLNCPEWLASYRSEFLESVSARGIEPPVSLKSFLSSNYSC